MKTLASLLLIAYLSATAADSAEVSKPCYAII